MICSTCKFWKRNEPLKPGTQNRFGVCSNDAKFRYCGEIWESDRAEMSPDCLQYWDSESYSASFETGESFGCIHHQSAEGEKG